MISSTINEKIFYDSCMAIAAAKRQDLSISSDHLEQFSKGFSSLTIDPYRNALYYFFPCIGIFFSSYQLLRKDPSLEAMMPLKQTESILREIEELTFFAGIGRKINTYVALNHTFSHSGGSFSITKPALFIPEQHLFRRDNQSPFPNEKQGEGLKEKTWIFSDDETRFLIARELGQMKENSTLLKIAIKTTLLAALFLIYTTPFGMWGGLGLLSGAASLYIYSERLFEGRADEAAIDILAKKIKNPTEAAISALEKMRQQNLYRRQNSWIAKFYITESGNQLLDFTHPRLTNRIEKIKKKGDRIREKKPGLIPEGAG